MSGSRKEVPNDPNRRQRILDAALEGIVEAGTAALTYRSVAKRAGVPLGSLTYYFAGKDELIAEAFAMLADRMAEQYRDMLEAATSPAEAQAAVVELIAGEAYADDERVSLLFEMYAYGNHNSAAAETARAWLDVSLVSLSRHFPEPTARALDALIEGWAIHRVFRGGAIDRDAVVAAVRAIVASGVGADAEERSASAEAARSSESFDSV